MSMQVRPESDIAVGGMMELAFRHIFAMYAHRLRHPLYVHQPYVSQAGTQGGGSTEPPFCPQPRPLFFNLRRPLPAKK